MIANSLLELPIQVLNSHKIIRARTRIDRELPSR